MSASTKCKRDNCYERARGSPYCSYCSCGVEGCSEPRMPYTSSMMGYPKNCTKHSCMRVNCGEPAVASDACVYHTCKIKGCNNPKAPYNKDNHFEVPQYCEDCICAEKSCTNLKQDESNYCKPHACQNNGCKNRKIKYDPRKHHIIGRPFFCEDCTCKYRNCTARIEIGDSCGIHICKNEGCKNRRINYCPSDHFAAPNYCEKCTCDAEKCMGKKVSEEACFHHVCSKKDCEKLKVKCGTLGYMVYCKDHQ